MATPPPRPIAATTRPKDPKPKKGVKRPMGTTHPTPDLPAMLTVLGKNSQKRKPQSPPPQHPYLGSGRLPAYFTMPASVLVQEPKYLPARPRPRTKPAHRPNPVMPVPAIVRDPRFADNVVPADDMSHLKLDALIWGGYREEMLPDLDVAMTQPLSPKRDPIDIYTIDPEDPESKF
jgi:hypothetical protein